LQEAIGRRTRITVIQSQVLGAMTKTSLHNLCFPDGLKTCFACCPPIRPAGYEHADYEAITKRVLRENTGAYVPEERKVKPITGYSCWALGYLDTRFRLVGCLLHPARHHGKDLRYRVDFGEKCRREACQEAHVFDCLEEETRAFWLQTARGLDSFAYSNRRKNPLFHFLNWGPDILKMIAGMNHGERHSANSLSKAFPLLTSRMVPRASVYPVKQLASLLGPEIFCHVRPVKAIESGLEDLVQTLRQEGPFTDNPYFRPVHGLHMERSFLDFLRLGGGIRRIETEKALILKDLVDDTLERLARKINLSPGSQ